jgi:hypothetical protein
MIINPVIYNKRYPYLIVDNFYNEDEYNSVFNELESFQDILENDDSPELQKELNGVINKTRIYLDKTYLNRREQSVILSIDVDKICTDKIMEAYDETTPASVTFRCTNSDWTQVSYYEGGDTYLRHYDSVMHTCLIYINKEPKRFTGGNLKFTKSNQVVEFKNNRLVIFPSYYIHEVDEVIMDEKDLNKGLGRYCITHFFSKMQ